MTDAPLLVLGAPRSGAGALAGLFAAAAGLPAGDTPPPSETHPLRGASAVDVIAGHDVLLRALGRDWTCPPSEVAPDATGAEIISAHIARMPSNRDWVATETTLPYLLPVWLRSLPAVRIVAAVRAPTAAARSIVAAHGLAERDAATVVGAYTSTIAQLQRQLGFPVVAWSASPLRAVRTAAAVATAMGMSWDEAAALHHVRPSLLHQRHRENEPNADYRTLLEAAEAPPSNVHHSADDVRRALSELDHAAVRSLPTHLGGAFAERRRRVWRAVDLAPADTAIDLIPQRTPETLLGPVALEPPTIVRYGQPAEIPSATAAHAAPTIVVATGLLDRMALRDMEPTLAGLHSVTQPGARLFVDLADEPAAQLAVGPTVVESVTTRAGWQVAGSREAGGRRVLVLQKREAEASARIASLEAEVERLRSELARKERDG